VQLILVVFNKRKQVAVFHQLAPTLYQTVNESEVNSHVRNNTSLKSAKNCANWCRGFKDVCIRVQWPSMILHVKSGLLTLSLGGATLCYKVDKYRCIEDQTASKCPKII